MAYWDTLVSATQWGYLLVSLLFLGSTYLEGWHRREGWDFHRILGLALCFAWPLLIVAVVVDVRRQRGQTRSL